MQDKDEKCAPIWELAVIVKTTYKHSKDKK
jgi:hypothetical protein